jgi:hypothetical protein
MDSVEFSRALTEAWHMQPMGAGDDKRLKAVVGAAWAILQEHRAPPAAAVADVAVAQAKAYHRGVQEHKGSMKRFGREPSRSTVAYRERLELLESRIRAAVVAAVETKK